MISELGIEFVSITWFMTHACADIDPEPAHMDGSIRLPTQEHLPTDMATRNGDFLLYTGIH